MVEELARAAELKAELDTFRPLSPEAEDRIMQKFRLDWNYNSNHLEGNQLTYGETRALILFGVTAQGKPLKDHIEMTGHNEAIELIIDVIKEQRPLTEAFLRELHVLLLKEPHYIDAQTPDGQPTRRPVDIGKYKSQPNHVRTVTGETFYFATPEETPAKMHDLLDWYREKKDAPDTNPIVLAAEFHYRFILIHPFDDGNGRMARLLMNFILMQSGYPPVIVKTDDKENYLNVLRLADAGNLEPFIEYITNNLIQSLDLMIRGAKGESIEEPDDLDKELILLDQRIKGVKQGNEIQKNENALFNLFDQTIAPLIHAFYNTCRKFDKFYSSLYANFVGTIDGTVIRFRSAEDAVSWFRRQLKWNSFEIELRYEYDHFNRIGIDKFSYVSYVNINLSPTKYTISNTGATISYTKNIAEQLNQEEISKLVNEEAKSHKEFIEQKIKEVEANGE